MSSKMRRLRTARKRRSQAAYVLGRLEAGELKLSELLINPPPSIQSVRLWTLLKRAPKLGEIGARRTLVHAKVWPEERLRNLSDDERLRVVAALPQRAK